ncbi:DUF7527 domain-containing protein [Halobacterium rubrum]|uniref:DUF7527 domain-containing protein n=1 Tax=Halobacterium TaxID=2239 RepID=UPI001F2B641C|nr:MULTISPECIES: hypothetical protein [Halobacterium]MDH5021338.1 hypothetical protein [Halobacterium rubrum]
MQARTVERVESWDSRPFSGGVGQLHELADADFSGAVSAGETWLFLLNGRVIGVFGGDVEDVADAEGTVYEAPHESVALLYAMQQRGGETQAKYYTNDTPLSEAGETLSDAKFTGYIELSENVLSGDYYVVYYGGRSMSAAFVGTTEELITGDEAFERADDEVGVYEVVKTPVNVTELPPREDEADGGEDTDSDANSGAAAGAAAGVAADASADAAAESDEVDTQGTDASLSTGQRADDSAADPSESTPSDASSASPDGKSGTRGTGDTPAPDSSDESGGGSRRRTEATADSGAEAAEDGGTKAKPPESDQAFDDEREWRETTSVPTIDPEDSEDGSGARGSQARTSTGTSSGGRTKSSSSSSSSSSGRSGRSRSGSSSSGPKSTVEKLKQAVKQREQKLQAASERIDALEGERDDLEAERERLQERVDTLESERDDLESTVAGLESELAAAEASEGSDDTAATDLNAVDALSGTNLFVRYESKGKPTLDELKDTTDPDAVNENLRIDHHTQFDAESATVDGESFESFLEETTVYRFVSWAVRALPYEVRDSGHQSGLADLYGALPQVDRAELNGTVEVTPDEDTTVSRTFDVVLRDRMGNPLVVADVSTGRDPVTGDQMTALVEDATAIREGSDDLAAAMYVTGSFFQPAALETADEETAAGGLFSRADRESFVKVGRKAGYHLCLVEDRNDAFHLTVPEL